MKGRKLEVGETFLTVKILNGLQVSAFKNKEKQGNEPDYLGNGIAVWVNKKKESPQVTEEKL